MKKYSRICSLLLCLLLTASLALPASAADGKVTYKGKSSKFIFAPGSTHSPTDLFPDLKNVMPGDTLTDTIVIKNGISGKKLKVYIRSLGAQGEEADAETQEGTQDLVTKEESAAFLSQMKLKVTKANGSRLYEAPADQTAQLTNWVYLGMLRPGGKTELDLTLTVPIEMSSDYENQVGYIDWEFKVEEIPITDAPQTGDYIYMAAVAMTVSLGVLLLLLIVKKWKKKSEE